MGLAQRPEGLERLSDLVRERDGVKGKELPLEALALGVGEDAAGQEPLVVAGKR
jgi:hypothetical protein